jgi:tetratricopeptide (TPR) repeat protein
VSGQLGSAEGAAHLVGLDFDDDVGRRIFLLLYSFANGKDYEFVKQIVPEAGEVKTEKLVAAGVSTEAVTSLSIQYKSGTVTALINGTQVWSGRVAAATDLTPMVGGWQERDAQKSRVSFSRYSVGGSCGTRWFKKFQAETEDVLEAELNKEYRLTRAEPPPDSALVEPSALDPLVERLPEDLAREFRLAREELTAAVKAGAVAQRALTRYLKLCQRMAKFPLPFYWAGYCYEWDGEYERAIEMHSKALELEPDFPDPLVGRAYCRRRLGMNEAARADLDRAMRLQPDMADAYQERTMNLLRERRRAEALEAIKIAEKLRPWDPTLIRLRRETQNAARGPLWKSPQRYETDRYTVTSDLPRDRIRPYAETMEVARRYFEEVIPPPTKFPKDEVYLFNTREGFYNYADLTLGSRMQHTQAFFDDYFMQVMVYESTRPEDTYDAMLSGIALQYVSVAVPGNATWFRRGMAEFLASIDVSLANKKVIVTAKPRQSRVLTLKGLMASAVDADALTSQGLRPRDLMLLSRDQFYDAKQSARSAVAWSFVQFMMGGSASKYRTLWDDYVRLLKEGNSPRAAYVGTWGRADMDAIERDWFDFVRTLTTK